MVAQIDDVAMAADFVLVLIATKEKSAGNPFGAGYRVINQNFIDCDIWQSGQDIPAANESVSICTMENLYYKIAPPKPGAIQYALALVSGLTAASESRKGNFMIDYLEPIGSTEIEAYKKALRKLATLSKTATFAASPAEDTPWSPSSTPFKARKTRRLAESPTDASLPEEAASMQA